MSLTTALAALRAARGSFVSAIREKGVEIADSATLHECASAVSLIPQGGEGDFYECASVAGADPEIYYAVSGAGMSAVNGNYTDTGTTWKSSPVYSNTASSTTYYMVHDAEYDVWFILDYIPGESDNPLPSCLYYKESFSEQWYIQEGADPVPTVTPTTVTHDLPKTWTGYKAVFDSTTGTYGYEHELTTDLTWSSNQPIVGKVYTADALAEIKPYYGGVVAWAPLHMFTDRAGQTLYKTGSPSFTTVDNVPCAAINSDQYIYYNAPFRLAVFTLSAWLKSTGRAFVTFSGGNWGERANEIWLISDSEWIMVGNGAADSSDIYSGAATSDWVNIIAAWTGTEVKVWINGQSVTVQRATGYSFSNTYMYLYIGSLQRANSERGNGYYAGIRLYDRVITDDEAAAIYAEFAHNN